MDIPTPIFGAVDFIDFGDIKMETYYLQTERIYW